MSVFIDAKIIPKRVEVSNTLAWTELKLNPQLLKAVQEEGFQAPTEIQQRVIPLALGGQAIIGIAQTGTGKTAAYLLPILKKLTYAQETAPRALVLAPTKELVVQIADHATRLSRYTDLRTVALYGGVGPKSQIESLKKGTDLVIATPGRFMELYLRQEITTKLIKTLVLDEADRMLDMGFMPQLRKVFEVIPQKRQNLLFSATFPPKVEKLAEEFLLFPVKVEVTPQSTPAREVEQWQVHVPNLKTKINLLDYLLQDKEKFNRVLVFARTKQAANDVFKYIDRKKLGPVRVIHSNKGQNTRINAMNEFREGGLRVLVSTDVSSRGIDVSNVSHVINFDVPLKYDDYVHRIGRTGRAHQLGEAITFVTKAEEFHIANIEKIIRERIPTRKLPKEVEIAETSLMEQRDQNRELDRQKRLADPTFQGAFHERKRHR
ncbi:MAG: DEAD/DEAH box helicase [Cyclobacteriaceae bacterium]|nr:DEAD/DEAH box helicase [Cyclobacteriaceae bacterium]